MTLSIIIVNYNVKYFLEQCLRSVQKAVSNIDAEVIVVDNNSVDGSVAMMHEKFPDITLIENTANTGFSKANNQAIQIATGKYVLLLNPDTLVEEDTFSKVVRFMDQNDNAGGLGVKMIDGAGNFLPESKRGLPTPLVAFYKIFGFSALFPKSKTFSKYHLGYLDKNKTHEVDVLSGAFMLIRKEVLDKIGLLDETFFMYGEDIDLSYRITKAGYKNYYFPETTIIHYKGESTKKGSINYVLVFYRAMAIFAKKHFSAKRARTFNSLIHLAIYFRAFLSLLKRFILHSALPVLDAVLIYLGFFIFLPFWEQYKFHYIHYYPREYSTLVIPAYILIWLAGIFFYKGYVRPISLIRALKGIGVGTVLILLIYSLLSEAYRFSRALILLGSLGAGIISVSLRWGLHLLLPGSFRLKLYRKHNVAIVGEGKEVKRVLGMLKESNINMNFLGQISTTENSTPDQMDISHLGNISQLRDIVRINAVDELIFCSKTLSSSAIINQMVRLSDEDVNYKIAPPESLSIIGSNSIHTSGELYILDINSIAKESNKRNKRILDVSLSLLFLFCSPVFALIVKKPLNFAGNIFKVLRGKYSWVGFLKNEGGTHDNLPEIKPGVLTPLDSFKNASQKIKYAARLNLMYAKDYKISSDIYIVLKGFRDLGRNNI